MPGFGDIVQKAFYLGVGLASYAGEKAGGTLSELRQQAQKLTDEMVARGEMTTEEAKRVVDEMMRRAQQPAAPAADASSPDTPKEPRRIEILSDEEETSAPPDQRYQSPSADDLRQQVSKLQEELRKLQRDP